MVCKMKGTMQDDTQAHGPNGGWTMTTRTPDVELKAWIELGWITIEAANYTTATKDRGCGVTRYRLDRNLATGDAVDFAELLCRELLAAANKIGMVTKFKNSRGKVVAKY